MTKNKKLTIIIAAALLVVAGIAAIATTQLNKTPTPPIVPAVTQSSASPSSEASGEPEKVVAPDIVITEKTESKPTSSEVKTLAVEGDPEAKPTESTKPVSSKPVEKPKPTSSVPVSSKPAEKPKPTESQPEEKPSQPKDGDTRSDGAIYIDGFGWIEYEGENSQGGTDNGNHNGNKVGDM